MQPTPSLETALASTGQTLSDLMVRLEARAQQATATLKHLRRLDPHQQSCLSGPYRVFSSEATGQLIILRAVAQLDAAHLVYETDSLADALTWVNSHLATVVAAQSAATAFDDLRPCALAP